MPTCSQAKILTNLESGIQKRAQLRALNNSNNDTNEFVATELESFIPLNSKVDRKSPVQNYFPRNFSHRNVNQIRRRISIDEIQTNQFEPNQQKVLHKVPIVFDEKLKKGSFSLYSQYSKQKINSRKGSFNLRGGSDGEADLSQSSDEYNSDKSRDGNYPTVDKRNSEWAYSQHLLHNYKQKKRPTARRSIDIGQLKKILPEDTNAFLSTRVQEAHRRNSLLNQNQNVLSTHFPKIALEIESIVDDELQNLGGNQENQSQKWHLSNPDQHQIFSNLRQQELIKSLNAKRLLALASIRPSITFHKSMTVDEIQVLKKYYELLKPKVPNRNSENKSDEEIEQHQPTFMYDTAKLKLANLQNLKTFLAANKKAIDSGEVVVDYDVDNDGAPAGFVLRQATGDMDIVTKFPTDTNDAFFAFTCINGTDDKVETKLGEANLFRVLNWNDTTALCDIAATKKFSAQKQNQNNFQISSSLLQSTLGTASLTSTSSTSSPPAELSFEYIKSLSSLVNSVVPVKLSKQLKNNAIDISSLPGGASNEIPTFEELGINLNNLISTSSVSSGGDLPPIEYQSQKLKVTAYKALKEKVSTTKTMWFNGPPERKPLSVIFEYAGDDDFGHEKILQEVEKCLRTCHDGHVVSLEFVPRSVQLGSVYVENQWILTLNNQKTKFFCINNGLFVCDEKIEVQSYDEFIFGEFDKFIRVEKYKHLIKNHEKAVLSNQKKYAATKQI